MLVWNSLGISEVFDLYWKSLLKFKLLMGLFLIKVIFVSL